MLKRFTSLILLLTLVSSTVMPAHAVTVQDCKEEVTVALDTVMGDPSQKALRGYFKQLSDLMSTSVPTHLLLDQVQELARDAWVEMNGICQQVQLLEKMDDLYMVAYDLPACQQLSKDEPDFTQQLIPAEYCRQRLDEHVNVFFDTLREYLLKQAIRTSMEPLVLRMRSLNARLVTLLSEYSRVVNNFFTLSFRLGDTITGERD